MRYLPHWTHWEGNPAGVLVAAAILLLVTLALLYGKKGLSRFGHFLSSRNKESLLPTHYLSAVVLLVKKPEIYEKHLREINENCDVETDVGRESAALMLASNFHAEDVLGSYLAPLESSNHEQAVAVKAQEKLNGLTMGIEQQLGTQLAIQSQSGNPCCLFILLLTTCDYTVEEATDAETVLSAMKELLDQPRNFERVLNFLFYPRPGVNMYEGLGRSIFDEVVKSET